MTTVLIVDDDKFARSALETTFSTGTSFSSFDLQVIGAGDGQEGLDAFLKHQPQVVVTDIQMPQRDGFFLCEKIRATPQGDKVHLVVISGIHRDDETAQRIRGTYNAEFFAKPYELREMTEYVAEILGTLTPPQTTPSRIQPVAKYNGNLAKNPLPAVLLDLCDETATGELTITRGGISKTIEILQGSPVSVTSSVREETLGHLLVSSGRITEIQHEAAVTFAAKNSLRLGESLIRMGALSPELLVHALTAQTRHKLTQSLRWNRGTWKFVPCSPEKHGGRGNPIDLLQTVIDGLRDTAILEPLPTHLSGIDRAKLKLSGRGQQLLTRMRATDDTKYPEPWPDTVTVADLVRDGARRSVIYACLDVLLLCGGMELPTENHPTTNDFAKEQEISMTTLSERSQTRRPDPLSAPLGSPIQSILDTSSVDSVALDADNPPSRDVLFPHQEETEIQDAATQTLLEEYLRVQGLDHYAVLQTKPTDDRNAISAAIIERRSKFSQAKFNRSKLGEHYAKLEEIHAAYDRAFDVLSDETKRKQYDAGRPDKSTQPDNALQAEVLFRKGNALLEQAKYSEAIRLIANALREFPDEPDYLATLGWAYYLQGKRTVQAADKARQYLNRALAIHPDHPRAHEYTGLISSEIGNDAYEATLHLEMALTADPSRVHALSALESIWQQRGQQRLLARKYRQLIYHVAGRQTDLERVLWVKLAELYRNELHDIQKAKVAYESASRLAPKNASIHSALADLDSGSEDRFFEHSQQIRERWSQNIFCSDPGLELMQAAETADQPDTAFLAASVLVANANANDHGKTLYHRHRPKFVLRAQVPLDEQCWNKLRCPDDSAELGQLFSLLAPLISQIAPMTPKDLGLEEHMMIADADLPVPVVRTRAYVAHMLGVKSPGVMVVPDFGAQVHVGAFDEPVLLVGEDVLTDPERLEVCFRLGQAMSYLIPGRMLGGSRPEEFLTQVLEAAAQFVSGSTQHLAGNLRSAVCKKILLLSKPAQEKIHQLVTFLSQAPPINLSRWSRGLAFTAARIGLLLCGDVPAVTRFCNHAPSIVEDLLQYSVSSQHLTLRSQLGLSVHV